MKSKITTSVRLLGSGHEIQNIKIIAMSKKLVFVFALITLASCSEVKEYQKSKINDSDMELAAKKSEKFENTFMLYREASSGANGGKTGGGCGCN